VIWLIKVGIRDLCGSEVVEQLFVLSILGLVCVCVYSLCMCWPMPRVMETMKKVMRM